MIKKFNSVLQTINPLNNDWASDIKQEFKNEEYKRMSSVILATIAMRNEYKNSFLISGERYVNVYLFFFMYSKKSFLIWIIL